MHRRLATHGGYDGLHSGFRFRACIGMGCAEGGVGFGTLGAHSLNKVFR
jgi:hypothetical protein